MPNAKNAEKSVPLAISSDSTPKHSELNVANTCSDVYIQVSNYADKIKFKSLKLE